MGSLYSSVRPMDLLNLAQIFDLAPALEKNRGKGEKYPGRIVDKGDALC